MTQKYESYNSAYPLAYYEVGKVYAFYGTTGVCAEPAAIEQVQAFVTALDELETGAEPKPDKITDAGKLHRYYAVVVAKESNSIVVMFQNNNADGGIEYLTKSYIVDAEGCDTDGMDLMPTSGATSYCAKGTERPKATGVRHDSEGDLPTGVKADNGILKNNKAVSGLKGDDGK